MEEDAQFLTKNGVHGPNDCKDDDDDDDDAETEVGSGEDNSGEGTLNIFIFYLGSLCFKMLIDR